MIKSIKNMGLIEMITYSVVLIKCHYEDGTMRRTTGVMINLCSNKEEGMCAPAIITANHVLEDSIKTVFEFCKADSLGNPIDTETFEYVYEGKTWIRHPDKDVDMRCIFFAKDLDLIEKAGDSIFYIPLETYLIPSKAQINGFSVMEEVVMVGYPDGLFDAYNHRPIIRRGITSTHPKNNYQGKKEILLDMGYCAGFSGSPVFILNNGAHTFSESVKIGTKVFFAGIFRAAIECDSKGIDGFSEASTVMSNSHMNYGVVIKAERILEFENMIH